MSPGLKTSTEGKPQLRSEYLSSDGNSASCYFMHRIFLYIVWKTVMHLKSLFYNICRAYYKQNYIYLLIVPVTACAQYGNICHCVVAGIFLVHWLERHSHSLKRTRYSGMMILSKFLLPLTKTLFLGNSYQGRHTINPWYVFMCHCVCIFLHNESAITCDLSLISLIARPPL